MPTTNNVPYTFGNESSPIPLSQLDVNFATVPNYANNAGNVTNASQPAITTVGTLTSLSVAGNINAGANVNVVGNIHGNNLSTTGSITGGALTVANAAVSGTVSAAGTVTGGAFLTNGSMTALGTITGGEIVSTDTLTVSNTANVGYLVSQGTVSALRDLSVSGNILANGQINVGGNVTGGSSAVFVIQNTANSSAPLTGALQVYGGASIARDLWVSGNIFAANIYGTQANVITVEDPLLYLRPSNNQTYPYNYDIGFYSAFTGGTGNTYQHTGLARDFNDNTWKLFSNVAEPAGSTLVFDGNTVYDAFKAGSITSTGFVSATGNITGGNVLTGGLISATGNITGTNITGTNITGANILTTGILSVAGTTALSGIATAPTVANGTSNTQIATTSFVSSAVYNATASLGTMSTQNANAVNITGGTISGLGSALPVASGGTGLTSPGTSGNVLASDGTNWISSAPPGSIGINQTWQNVAGSRSTGVVYTNTTGKPIEILITLVNTNGAWLYINGNLVIRQFYDVNTGAGQQGFSYLTAIIPDGNTYEATSGGVYTWWELR
jgi:hypothetical protein